MVCEIESPEYPCKFIKIPVNSLEISGEGKNSSVGRSAPIMMLVLSANSLFPISVSSADINNTKFANATTMIALKRIDRGALKVNKAPITPTIKSAGLEVTELSNSVVAKRITAIANRDALSPIMRGKERMPDCPSSSKSFKTLATWAAAPSNEPAPIIHSGGVSSTAKTMDAGSAANAITYGKGERGVYLK